MRVSVHHRRSVAAACGTGVLTLVCVVLAAAPRAAQQPAAPGTAPQPQQPPTPTFRLGASYVRVDVYPTRDGEAVQDLERGDVELLEDGVPQTIEQFERISVQSAVDPALRRDPNTVAESREQAGDPRRRVFVVFLDTGMTTLEGSHAARKPIVEMLDHLIGDDDLFAVMTPDMRGSDITFARRTGSLDAELAKYWTWGQRDALNRRDPEEIALEMCFPDPAPEKYCTGLGGKVIKQPADAYRGVARQLIERRAEQRTIRALEDLAFELGSVREERKAVIVVSQGWRLLQPKPELTRLQECDQAPVPGKPGVDHTGRLVPDLAKADPAKGIASDTQCHALANHYAFSDNAQEFRHLVERANRFNVSFYPIDTRGLIAFDQSIGARDDRIRNDPGERSEIGRPNRGPLNRDMDRALVRVDSLRTLAEATDGLAVVNTNDMAAGARRIVNDLSTYYLIGYQSTNPKLDGRWRAITVKVKTPGVRVRARKGYRALTEAELALLRRGETPPPATGDAATGAGASAAATAVSRLVAPLAALDRPLVWRSRAAWGPGSSPGTTRFWVASEVDSATLRQPEWAGGGTWTATLALADGRPVADATLKLEPGSRALEASLEAAVPASTEVLVRLRLTPAAGGLPLSDTVRIAPSGTSGRLFRRGPTTGRQFVAAGDLRFRRAEHARVALPIADASAAVEAALLDRAGTVLRVPVAARVETIDGSPWAVGELALAPLSAGDYVIRVVVRRGDDAVTTLAALRVVN
jgi:VWFA-related protein